MMKRMTKVILVLMVTLFVTAGYPISVHAQEETQLSQFMRTLQQVTAKVEPNDSSETAFTYEDGDIVYIIGETEDGWYIVYYQGQTGYINKDKSQDVLVAEEIDIEALDEEMAAQETENKMIVEAVERYRAEARRSRIWGAAIVILVIGIFAVGIISTVRAENEGREKNILRDNQKNRNAAKEEPQDRNYERNEYSGDILDLDKE